MNNEYLPIIINNQREFYRGTSEARFIYNTGYFFSTDRKVAQTYASKVLLSAELRAKKILVVDGKHALYSWMDVEEIDLSEESVRSYFKQRLKSNIDLPNVTQISTDNIGKFARELGYDAVIFNNVLDGNYTCKDPVTDIIVNGADNILNVKVLFERN